MTLDNKVDFDWKRFAEVDKKVEEYLVSPSSSQEMRQVQDKINLAAIEAVAAEKPKWRRGLYRTWLVLSGRNASEIMRQQTQVVDEVIQRGEEYLVEVERDLQRYSRRRISLLEELTDLGGKGEDLEYALRCFDEQIADTEGLLANADPAGLRSLSQEVKARSRVGLHRYKAELVEKKRRVQIELSKAYAHAIGLDGELVAADDMLVFLDAQFNAGQEDMGKQMGHFAGMYPGDFSERLGHLIRAQALVEDAEVSINKRTKVAGKVAEVFADHVAYLNPKHPQLYSSTEMKQAVAEIRQAMDERADRGQSYADTLRVNGKAAINKHLL
ncbi:MAG: hypothetical protein ABIG95_01570 [Candidatus Woesearchaeota archaeon]